MLSTRQAACRQQGRELLAPCDLQFTPGKVHAILGPNGAGKSTLLRLLSGEWPCSSGSVSLSGRELRDWPLPALARQRAVLPQMHALSFPFTAREVVRLGRLHAARRSQDEAVLDAALAVCGVSPLQQRLYTQLSGGERARVQLARTLAQIWDADPATDRYLLLDEPTAHLDLAYQHACLRLARDWAARGVGVIVVLHDPNLVLSYADCACLLHQGRVQACGQPREVITPARMRQVFGLDTELQQGADGRIWLAVNPQPLVPAPR
ncbi:iron complex transport system ATP-binding protein [Solimonas aquatica]|uniref:Iron complex transport system ATP-binding protein n=1 Tax=Solimonas aquatica TaxID=489703 RepID=A0A1H8ZRB2_9GAMM|nr:heme ABC transporter ATP-binding protein [Solimonas aquatica]SEP66238.1 iron complex transport system ATP-binding protein [Solimonas aquatica]